MQNSKLWYFSIHSLRSLSRRKTWFIVRPKWRTTNFQSGVSLVELLLIVASIGFLVLLIGNLPNSINLIGRARHQSLAREIAAKAIEDTRATVFANLADGTISLTDNRVNLLPTGSGTRLIEPCSPTVCTGGEAGKVKQVSVTVIWKEAGKTQTVKLQTLVSEGGLNQ